jgi:hypothetical protein
MAAFIRRSNVLRVTLEDRTAVQGAQVVLRFEILSSAQPSTFRRSSAM